MKIRFLSILTLLILINFTASANESPSTELEKTQQPTQKTQDSVDTISDQAKEKFDLAKQQLTNKLNETQERRGQADYFALLNYSPLDLLIPAKYGFTLGLINNASKTWELEYLRGSISVPFIIEDLGKMTDERISIISRSYSDRNSFNFSYGLSYFDFSLHLGDKLLNRVTAGNYPSLDLVQIQSLGLNFAIGNRWSFNRNVTFGIDWFSWAQPLMITKKQHLFLDYASNQEDRDDVEKSMKLITYFPRLAFLKLQFGILF